ncbi:DUF4833 domain-containing protein [Parapedobacter sp. 10938]|uniref:DUF4833 domain-containing protein n=1 Tax=Parapedobacter flavus TaxID=3110225 RepID=UPI002DBA04C5|nr:DUF4833 domain-containing protein [Parapedobacter sp. 10938]MEC3880800.1 DUF4833 domain-containing protein [Parapedobacter sp. 10938]
MLGYPLLRPHALYDLCSRGSARNSLYVLLLFSGFTLTAQERQSTKNVVVDSLPVPDEPKQLFYLQRDPDANTVIYQLNTVDGVVDVDEPVKAYWIRYAEGGTRKDLNFLQRTMAYGISHKALDDGAFELRLAAYKDHPLRLAYCEKSKTYKVYTTIDRREAALARIFVRIDGGSVLSPNIMYFELTGRDTTTQAQVSERIKPVQ